MKSSVIFFISVSPLTVGGWSDKSGKMFDVATRGMGHIAHRPHGDMHVVFAFYELRRSKKSCAIALRLLAQHEHQIQRRRLGHTEQAEDGMRLAAMVRLVIEQVGENVADAALLGHARGRGVVQGFRKRVIADVRYVANDALIFRLTRGPETG
jgi:hypothetical protein